MGFEIVWTKKAVQTFGKRVEYLEEHWTEKEIYNFTTKVNSYLKTLRHSPLIFRESIKLKGVHICTIIKQVSLVYKVDEKKQIIKLVAFIDNRQNPKKQNY